MEGEKRKWKSACGCHPAPHAPQGQGELWAAGEQSKDPRAAHLKQDERHALESCSLRFARFLACSRCTRLDVGSLSSYSTGRSRVRPVHVAAALSTAAEPPGSIGPPYRVFTSWQARHTQSMQRLHQQLWVKRTLSPRPEGECCVMTCMRTGINRGAAAPLRAALNEIQRLREPHSRLPVPLPSEWPVETCTFEHRPCRGMPCVCTAPHQVPPGSGVMSVFLQRAGQPSGQRAKDRGQVGGEGKER